MKMSGIKELIRTEEDGTLSFGAYELAEKAKKSDYEYKGDLYKVKTFDEITKLEKNGMFIYESVPGTAVHHFHSTQNGVSFEVEGKEMCIRDRMNAGRIFAASLGRSWARQRSQAGFLSCAWDWYKICTLECINLIRREPPQVGESLMSLSSGKVN